MCEVLQSAWFWNWSMLPPGHFELHRLRRGFGGQDPWHFHALVLSVDSTSLLLLHPYLSSDSPFPFSLGQVMSLINNIISLLQAYQWFTSSRGILDHSCLVGHTCYVIWGVVLVPDSLPSQKGVFPVLSDIIGQWKYKSCQAQKARLEE